MTPIQDPQVIVALVGMFVTLPPTIYIIYKVYLRRQLRRPTREVEALEVPQDTDIPDDMPLLTIQFQPDTMARATPPNHIPPVERQPQHFYYHRRTTVVHEEGVIWESLCPTPTSAPTLPAP
ncbi:hypothetical protein QBC38DRAFT_498847 [Podospora fimiseda]|uniref:Uncharacterized protein n=1 Tax=Podospora fimiseda TaxID=252190 RepID=A0AAN7H3F1_9PEZI|nr:hypothetical protein QBC38DRAFT_498847 [Podospora fimiseda]